MILLHGVTDSWRSFEPVLPHLPPSIHAFALTQRGHGDAERPAAGYRTRDFAGDVAAFADAFDLGPAVVVGHSMGSTNAQRFAIDYPERIRGLMLAGSFASYRGNPAVVEFWESAVSRLTDPIDPAFVRQFQEHPGAADAAGVPRHGRAGEPQGPGPGVACGVRGLPGGRRRGRARADPGAHAHRLGTRDSLCRRADQDDLLATIAGSRLVVYENAGHALHWEEPERFAADLVAFATRLVTER